MITNVDSQHEDVLCALAPYWEENMRAQSYVFTLPFLHPIKYLRLGMLLGRSIKREPRDILSGKTSQQIKDLAPIVLDYPRTEEQQRIRDELTADFSIHLIAGRLVAKYPDFDFAKIKKLHDERRSDRLKLTTKQALTVAVAMVAFVGKAVPKAVIEGDLGWNFVNFERGLFYPTGALILILGLMVVMEWFSIHSEGRKHEFFGRILAYVELALPKPAPNASL